MERVRAWLDVSASLDDVDALDAFELLFPQLHMEAENVGPRRSRTYSFSAREFDDAIAISLSFLPVAEALKCLINRFTFRSLA